MPACHLVVGASALVPLLRSWHAPHIGTAHTPSGQEKFLWCRWIVSDPIVSSEVLDRPLLRHPMWINWMMKWNPNLHQLLPHQEEHPGSVRMDLQN